MTDWQFRPARDHGLSAGDRLRSLGREGGLGSLLLGGAWRALVRLYLRLFHRLQVEGREHLPPPPFVIVCNHSSHLDALTVAAALPRAVARRAYALAAGDTFFTTLRGSAFAAYAVNALPVWRKRTKQHELAALRERLADDGLVYILFPEGTRTRDGSMHRFRAGIGSMVAGGQVPVVPCYLEGAFAAWPAHRRLPRPGRLHLHIGTPLRFPEQPDTVQGWARIAAACEQAVRALQPQGG